MKRFLILFILVVFVTVSCAGPNKVGGTKPTFNDEFVKGRWECIQSIDSNQDSEAFGKALKECLAKKGYKRQEDKVLKWKKAGFREDEFEKDREDCIQSVKDDSEQMMMVEECLAKKGYELEPVPDPSEITAGKSEITVGKVLLIVTLSPVLVPLLALWLVLGAWH